MNWVSQTTQFDGQASNIPGVASSESHCCFNQMFMMTITYRF